MTAHNPGITTVAVMNIKNRKVEWVETVASSYIQAVLRNPTCSPVVARVAWGRWHAIAHAFSHLPVVETQSRLVLGGNH